jgi:Integrase zinc binding domain
MSFFFPDMRKRIDQYVSLCETCQMRSRKHWTDRTPITPIPRDEPSFGHIVFDCIGPIVDSPWPYALVITDLHTRWPSAYALRSLSAKAVCKALIDFFTTFGVPTYCHSDRGSNLLVS